MTRRILALAAAVAFLLLAPSRLAAAGPPGAAPARAPFTGPGLTDLYRSIPARDLAENPIRLLGDDWMIITAGTPEKFNSMTAGWGGLGIWKKPVAFILVNPSRYTFQFLEKEEHFTLSFYDPAKYRGVLENVFGGKSGRDTDKVKESGFTPLLTSPGIAYAEARTIIVCKKVFSTNTDPEGKSHKLFFGEILSVWVRK
jgi:flavin reductase (DIM6/NTAB) family NADH-FMN oxidoreductase RutF